jgi:hypothetical protein
MWRHSCACWRRWRLRCYRRNEKGPGSLTKRDGRNGLKKQGLHFGRIPVIFASFLDASVAQPGRASRCQRECRGFESLRSLQLFQRFAPTPPDLQKQTARAIANPSRKRVDRRVVLLIDTRFGKTRYRRLFPLWWKYVRVRQATAIKTALENFWNSKL